MKVLESVAQRVGYIQEEGARKAMLRVWGIFRRKVPESDAQSVGYIFRHCFV